VARAATDWHERGSCHGHPNPELWFPTHGQFRDGNQGKEICRGCPVRTQCLDYAQANPGLVGIWGGTTDTERREMRGRSRQ